MSTATKTMSDSQFKSLAKIIYDRAGIHFPETKKYIVESRLGHRLTELELDDFDQYIAFLTMGPYQSDEFQEMFNRITINETSFFRNEPQLDVFEKQILPELMEARKTHQAAADLVGGVLDGRGALHARDHPAPHAGRPAQGLDGRDPRAPTSPSARSTWRTDGRVHRATRCGATPDLVKSRYFRRRTGSGPWIARSARW
jgi:hypothetical protein